MRQIENRKMDLQKIKNYFGEQMTVFPEAEVELSETQANILYDIGIPSYNISYKYVCYNKLTLESNRYLKLGTREEDKDSYSTCLDLQTGKVVFRFLNNEYNLLNTSLENYLICIYIYDKYWNEVEKPQIYGPYINNENHKKYSAELKRRLLEHNNDVNEGTPWSSLIEEMEHGVI